MAERDESRFRPQPGRSRRPGDLGAQKFTRQVLRAAQKAGAGVGPPLARGRCRGAEHGRGRVAARLAGARLGPRARRVVVKARLVVHARAAIESTAAHLAYIQRDSVTPDGGRGQLYSADRDVTDGDAFEARVAGDRHEFRFIVSPEDAAEIDDLKTFTRDLMTRMEADLGTALDWVAVDHHDTDNPHSHVVLRGVDDTGANLVIARDYISHGFRLRASELATEWLGPQTERELREKMTREVGQQRWTGLDRRLAELARDDGRMALEGASADRFQRGLLVGRLQALKAMGLAGKEPDGAWRMAPDAERTLRAMGERGDIVRTMQRAFGSADRPLEIHADAAAASRPIVGRIAGKGLVDELQDRSYLVVDGIDGRAHYVALPAGVSLADYPKGGIVEVTSRAAGPRSADRTIASIADADGLYRTARHVEQATRGARSGDDPFAFVEAHVRRLEALRRAGIAERIGDGVWRLPPDFLDRAAAHEAARGEAVTISLRSHLDLKAQVRAVGATWLDRSLLGSEPKPGASGFGAEVRAALAEREQVLVDEGLATRRAHRVVLAGNLLTTLRDRDVARTAAGLAAETGLEHRPVVDGERVRGVYRRSLQLASGRFAMLDDGIGFSLVPWKPVIEQRLGQAVSGVMRGGSISWDLSRQRGMGV